MSGLQLDEAASTIKETARTEAAALLERRMAAMEAVLAARRSAPAQAAEPEMARGPGADLRFAVSRRDVNNLAASDPLLQCSSLLCVHTRWTASATSHVGYMLTCAVLQVRMSCRDRPKHTMLI